MGSSRKICKRGKPERKTFQGEAKLIRYFRLFFALNFTFKKFSLVQGSKWPIRKEV